LSISLHDEHAYVQSLGQAVFLLYCRISTRNGQTCGRLSPLPSLEYHRTILEYAILLQVVFNQAAQPISAYVLVETRDNAQVICTFANKFTWQQHDDARCTALRLSLSQRSKKTVTSSCRCARHQVVRFGHNDDSGTRLAAKGWQKYQPTCP
jgi:hypothetical protein